jgi:hypothetical protein
MKLIVAGGRDFRLGDAHEMALALLVDHEGFTEIVTGGAPGVDSDAHDWASEVGLATRVFPADWHQHGKAAGPIRNREMAAYADAVVLFPGGLGTASMAREASAANLKIFDWRHWPRKAKEKARDR